MPDPSQLSTRCTRLKHESASVNAVDAAGTFKHLDCGKDAGVSRSGPEEYFILEKKKGAKNNLTIQGDNI